MDKFIVSARKYRPATFSTLIGQESIATTLKNSIKRGQLAHAYLFCGPRGVGKTTTARIFAKTINCMNPGEDLEPCGECESCRSFDEGRSYCIHELDAASNNSVDDIRALTEKVLIPPQVGKYGVYIIDEVHMLSTAAFNAFLKTLEEPPAHAIFILATTEKQKIIPTILSRCQVFDFNRISIPDIVKNLRGIAQKEGITIDDESLHVIAGKADGAMRDALTLFDQVVAYCGNSVDYASVVKNLNVLDYEYYFNLTDYSLNGRFAESLLLFDEVLTKGFNALYFIGGLGNHLRNLLICKETASAKLLEVSPALEVKYKEQAERCPLKFLFKALAFTEKCESDYARSNNQRLLVEFMLVKISQIQEAATQGATLQPAQKKEEKSVNEPTAEIKAEEVTTAEAPKPQTVEAPKPEIATQQEVVHQEAVQQETAPQEAAQQETVQQEATQQEATQQEATQQEATQQEIAQSEAPQKQVVETLETQPIAPVASASEATATDSRQDASEHEEQPRVTHSRVSIKGMMSQIQNEKKLSGETKEEQQPLDFMGPSTNQQVTKSALDGAWNKMAEFFETNYPKLVRFVATIRNTEPVLSLPQNPADKIVVGFPVGNVAQKQWIEQHAQDKMSHFLRQNLQNDSVTLEVLIKTKEEIAKKLYLPQEKDAYLTGSNPEFENLKKELGAELQ